MDAVVKEEKKISRVVENLIDENRIINFSDAVFAFAATLLILKIDLPNLDSSQVGSLMLPALTSLWPQYLANIISFLVIGYYWLTHHAIFGLIKKFNLTLVWLNLIFLIALSFLPFPVDLYGDYMSVPTVVVFYSISLAIVGFLLAGIWWYASRKHRLVDSELGKKQITYYTVRNLVAPVVFTLSIPLVYIHPLLAQGSWLFVLLGIFVVNKVFHIKKLSRVEEMSL